ncbi:hypothetical protein S23_02040 [Bradyrhizobium cosmicum]|uniref:Uncharacterized protein n=1 Tax=Bradyrhizobium cosmicum TaxID=1404864 RepID=A0AAI8M7I9_9BRAD|nr:hypothetical protein S23_02040 [Bradyrhizobium cosmicum]
MRGLLAQGGKSRKRKLGDTRVSRETEGPKDERQLGENNPMHSREGLVPSAVSRETDKDVQELIAMASEAGALSGTRGGYRGKPIVGSRWVFHVKHHGPSKAFHMKHQTGAQALVLE